jgi:hypothetical protein
MPKYDYMHKKRRAQERRKIDAGRGVCWRCGKPIPPGSEWHLGHDDAGERIVGPEHAYCNLEAAANRTNALRVSPVEIDVNRWSRHWENGNGYDERCPDCRRLGGACPVGAGSELLRKD